MATKIIISVSGGVVNGVFSNDKNVDVQIFDFDNAENKQTMEEFYNKAVKGMFDLEEYMQKD